MFNFFVELAQFLSEIGITINPITAAKVAFFFAGYFLVDYLQRKLREYWQNHKLRLTCDCEMHMKIGLHLDSLDESDKDNAKKSSEAKDETLSGS